jgi:hypothetical protein
MSMGAVGIPGAGAPFVLPGAVSQPAVQTPLAQLQQRQADLARQLQQLQANLSTPK